MRARLIVNPSSGADRAVELLALVNARLLTLVRDLDITITTSGDDAQRAAARAVEERCDALYVAGGDGTLNCVLRGLMAADEPTSCPIGVIPLGTGNDFAKALGLGEDVEEALDLLLDANVIDVDIGTVNDRPFANVSAGGFVADVSSVVTEGLKDLAGKLAYIIGGARALLGTEPFSAQLSVSGAKVSGARDWQHHGDLQMFAVCNAPMIGGGYPIAPAARIDDGALDVLLVRQMPALEFVRVLQMVAAGDYDGDERVLTCRAEALDLQFSRAVRVNTDGELLHADRCSYRVRHRALRFFCGPSPRASAAPRPLAGGR